MMKELQMTLEYPSWSRVAVLCLVSTIGITGGCININEARETGSQSTEQKFKQSGLTVALTSGLVDNLMMADSQLKAAQNTRSDRMKALAMVNAVAGAAQAEQSATQMKLSISVGTSSSQSKQQSSADSARGSSVKAGGNVTIQATGDGQNSDITIQGSNWS
jgi:filamentous hemagglutinin